LLNPMKTVILVIIIALIFTGCRIKRPAAGNSVSDTVRENTYPGAKFSEQSSWLLGYINPAQFTRPPHSEWYSGGFDQYIPDSTAMAKLMQINRDDITVTVVMGTWCPDSRREVPRFMKITDLWNFPAGNITFIGVDNTKLAPVVGYDTLDIERVPTFIFLKNKVEAGRIIENPETSLEQDIVNILTRNEK